MWIRIVGIVFIIMLLGMNISGCNTLQGIGQDVEEAGEGIEEAAD
jgi:predicted small secreted protein